MAVRYDAGRAAFRFSPSVLPAPPPSAAAATGISGRAGPSSYSLPPHRGGAPPAILALRYYRPSSSFSALPREA